MADTKLKLEVIMAAVDRITRPLKAVMEGSRQTSTEVKALRDKIKGLNDQAGQIESFRKLQSQTAVVGHNAAAAQDKVRQLAQQIQATETPTKAMTKAFEAARREAGQLSTQHSEMTQRVQRQRDALNAAGLATNALASHQRRLKGEVQSTTSALEAEQKKLEEINQRAQKLRAAQAEVTKAKATAGKLGRAGAMAMAGGAAVGAATAVPVKAYADAEEAATNLKVAMMGVGGEVPETYKKVTALATQLGNKLPGTTADFTNMMTMLQRQGLSAEKVLGGVGEATAYLAVQLKKTPEAAAEFAAKMQDATRTVDKDMLGLMDTIQRAYYLGVDDNNMLQGFAKLSPALSILRKEGAAAAKDLAPLLVMADQAGMAGEQAGNAYRKIFQLSMGTKKISKANAALQGTGVQLNFTDGKGEFGGMDKLFEQLGQLKNVNTQQRLHALKEAFGDDAETLQALTLIIEKGKAGYDDVARRMQTQADIQTRVNAQLGTLKNLWDAAAGTFTNAMAAFGEAIAPEMKAATVWLGSLSERMQVWASANPGMASALMNTVKWVGLLLLGFGGLAVVIAAVLGPFAMAKFALTSFGMTGSVLAPILSMITTALKSVGTAILWVGRLFLANPILAVVAAIAAAAVYVWSNWDTLGPKFWALWDGIKTGAAAAWSWVTDKARMAGQVMVDLFMNWTLPGLIIQHWDSITAFIGGLPAKFATMGGQIIDGLMGGISQRWEAAKGWFADMGNKIAQITRDALGIKSPSRVFAEIGGHVMGGLTMGLDGGEDGPLARIKAMTDKLAEAGKQITVAASIAIPAAAVQAMPMPAPMQAAQATLARMPQVAQVQEGTQSPGPLLATPLPAIDTRPPLKSNATPSDAASSVSVVNTITINAAPGMDEAALARLVSAEIDKATRRAQVAKRSRLTDGD